MNSRLDLQIQLETVLGSRNVYFQPPETLKIKYPAIIYNLSDITTRRANNANYLKDKKYNTTLIHNDPDNEIVTELIDKFDYCSFDRAYVSDNLYHYVFEIYY